MFEVINETNEEINITDINALLVSATKYLNLEDTIFNVILVDDKYIREINKTYRNVDKETDVISFALEDTKDIKNPVIRVLGDIYVSVETAKRQAYNYYNTFEEEVRFLVVHGLMHLLGYDHMIKSDEIKMRSLEEEVLVNYDPRRKEKNEEF